MLSGSGTALAHNSLVSSSPADGETVSAAPSSVTLTFNDVVQNIGPLVAVVGPDGGHYEGSSITAQDNKVTAAVNPLGPAGSYTVSYRIVSADGHPVEGTLVFTTSAAGTGKPNVATPDQQVASDAIPAWVWIVAAAVVLAIVLGFGLRSTWRRDAAE